MREPVVTVGMPVYNDPEGLRRTVPSVFGQTWPGPVKLLVVDDGSTDETPEVLASLAEVYGPIEVVRNEQNRGRPYARNTVLEHAGDGYLAWIDAGDLWHPRKLELQLATLREAEAQHPETPVLCTGPLRWVFADRGENRIKVPEVAGDQLRHALTGALYPYLQAIVGRAEHFRRLGFDERLPRRQDYDFLVRFLGEGGTVVSSPAHIPVFTYLKSDAGGRGEVVARANRVIRRNHAPYYRRYDARLVRRVRHNQDKLVARFHRHHRRITRSLLYGARAWLFRPGLPSAAARGRARAGSRRAARWALRPVVRLLRRTGVNRIGTVRRLAGPRVLRVLDRGAPIEDATALEAMAEAPDAAPEVWLRLERSYRRQGRLHSAESALRRALARHPEHPKLRLRLVELLPARRKWSECAEVWASLDQAVRDTAGAGAYESAARAMRELGDPAGALAVARAGTGRWPREAGLREEVYRNRAVLVDWRAAVAGSGPPPDDPPGTVTDLGFLAGGEGPVEGRVAAPAGGAPSVSLVVNGAAVATTGGVPQAEGEEATFALSCHGLLPYLGDGDVVAVQSDGRALHIAGYGSRCEVTTGYGSRFPALAAKLRDGHVFTKFGVLRRGNTRERKQRVLSLFDAVAAVLSSQYGYPAYPFYGNLLGAVREHDVIGHDVGGFDMGYVSRHERPEEVRAEFLAICRTLLERGFHLRFEPWSVYIRARHDTGAYVDLNYAWFSEAGELQFSFGWRYPPVTDRDRVSWRRDCPIAGHLVPVPGNAEAVLAQIYGPGWAVPDQGFALDAGLQRATAYLLTEAELRDIASYAPDQVLVRSVLTSDGQVCPYQDTSVEPAAPPAR